MKILVCGASGRCGRLLVHGALERGHDVTVLLRGADQGSALPADTHVIHGDILDGGAVSDAVDGQDAVLVALVDASTKSERQASAQGTLNVIRSMQRYRVSRLIVLSASIAHPGRDPNRSWISERIAKPLLHRELAAILRRMEVSVRQSGLDWTIVRTTAMTDDAARARYRVGPGYSLPKSTAIARADLVSFMLDEVPRRDNVGHAVALAY